MVEVVVLSSPTCMPCKMFTKRLDAAGISYTKLNAVDHPEYNVQSTPHIVIKKDGEELKNEHVNMGQIRTLIDYIQGL